MKGPTPPNDKRLFLLPPPKRVEFETFQVIVTQTQTSKPFLYLAFLPRVVKYSDVAFNRERSSMIFVRAICLAAIGLGVLVAPAFAGEVPAPGPIAGVGMPALALVGGAYWLGRKLFAGKK